MGDDTGVRVEPEHGRTERVRFCSRCGGLAEAERGERVLVARVCGSCGMGVYLECTADALGTLGTFFLIVGDQLRVTAVSIGAEGIFGEEPELLGRPVGELLRSPVDPQSLDRAVRRAALGVRERSRLPIEPASSAARGFGPLEARISPCGPPRAALVAIEPALA